MKLSNNRLIVILGPTACGKTNVATHLALKIGGEIISADSRQVYKGMDIGTGKDLSEYTIDNKQIDYHLIDIAQPGTEYNLFLYQNDFINALSTICKKGSKPILCGGTGMYINSILNRKRLVDVPLNPQLRHDLDQLTMSQLINRLASNTPLHNTTDTTDRERLIRAIEIQEYTAANPIQNPFPSFTHTVFGINHDRHIVMQRIEQRLKLRLETGMIDEVQTLIDNGVPVDKLLFYGLEYRYITQYLQNQIDYQTMFDSLNIAIRQFAKRQMTYFRKMEREGIAIDWIPHELNLQEKLAYIEEKLYLCKH